MASITLPFEPLHFVRTAKALVVLASLVLPVIVSAQPLVDGAWLKARVGQPGWVLLDASPMPIHRAGHIPGAVNADLMFGGTALPTQEQMQARLRAWGIGPDSRIVVYDNQDTMWATRVVFDLHRHGVPLERLHVLDGGLKAWQAAGGEVTKDSRPAPPPGTAVATPARAGLAVELPEVLAATGRAAPRQPGGRGELVLIEALEPPWYYGQRNFFGRPGHLPHARMWSKLDLLQADGRFKPLPELRRMAAMLGMDDKTPVLTYCGGGVAATLPWFALHVLMGWPQVGVYVGSQREWLRDERGLPMWSWAEPQRLRSADWLAAWNDDMLRLTGSARLSVIDVRPAADYTLGHVPHAHNLPAERWDTLRSDPQALRTELAASGLDPAHEIVLVGRGGLDPPAALAWATLEALGHRQVALLLESTDEWALRGHPLAKPNAAAPTAPRRPQPGWASMSPAADRNRDARVDRTAPRQVLRVDSRPAAAPGQTADTIALPWTEFVQPDRSLKAPHEIHERLTQAGVSRWAHVEVQAADPAEAAAALFVLRLVGWPSVAMTPP
ncbi:MAG: rhodanese-like domain-containing protein [Burkholderiaceae bacterium]|jgi:3-mercaptopyruvate sulfurtransferase SseA|nr:rhodanese-like domain-containing protein [Burkholderiaceae bacterium]MCU0963898.1 rhodanese-like domain-containing protein [Burkholderiaceae bacterium]